MTAERILVVDDEPQIQRFLRPALGAAGYEVVEAMTGGEALKAAATSAPDVIILDLGLPDMDGKDVDRQPPRLVAVADHHPLGARPRKPKRSPRSISARTITSKNRSPSAN